jgi:hypothetical protein
MRNHSCMFISLLFSHLRLLLLYCSFGVLSEQLATHRLTETWYEILNIFESNFLRCTIIKTKQTMIHAM